MNKKQISDTLTRADTLSEVWVGTTAGNIIDSKKRHVKDLLTSDINLASIAALELVQTLNEVEEI